MADPMPRSRMLRAEIAALRARAEKAEAKAAVIGGEWCRENRAAGRGPCGACASCCKEAGDRAERYREALETAARELEAMHNDRVLRGAEIDARSVAKDIRQALAATGDEEGGSC